MCGRSADLIRVNVMRLSIRTWMCVRAHIRLSLSISAPIRLNPQLSLTGLAEWTAEVYHCLLISSDSHQPIKAGHSVSCPCGSHCWGPGVNALWPTYLKLQSRCPSFCVRKSQISQSYLGQQMLLSFPLPV